MASKNDMSIFKKARQQAEQENPDPVLAPQPRPVAAPQPQQPASAPQPITTRKKVGRPAKPEAEKESVNLSFKFTPGEVAKIKEKAGLVPLSKYIKHYLRTETDLFD
tara:strand:- start:27519 stop:27839 length:321 start_codon:yes stop_codon:yes gene_type:complete